MTTYLCKDDNDWHVKTTKGFTPKDAVARVPQMIDPADYPFLYAEKVEDVELGSIEWVVKIDEEKKGKELLKKAKKEAKDKSKSKYLEDIDQKLIELFGTTDKDAASATYLTWLMMEKNPSAYSSKGLEDEDGNKLSSATKVRQYASLKIEMAVDYSVFLLKRRKQLKDELKSI